MSDLNWHNRLEKGETPTPYVLVTTHLGSHAFGGRNLSNLVLGQVSDLLSFSGRVISFGAISRTISPITGDLPFAFTSKQLSHLAVVLSDEDNFVTSAMADSPFLGGLMSLYIGFFGDPFSDHRSLFSGQINLVKVGLTDVTIEADEG